MTRLNALLVAAGLLSLGAAGCAQCDTCDDFPTPCTGPNCAGAYGGGYAPAPSPVPTTYGSAPVVQSAPAGPASIGPANDSAPAPSLPRIDPAGDAKAPLDLAKPPVDSASPPKPTEPTGRPGL